MRSWISQWVFHFGVMFFVLSAWIGYCLFHVTFGSISAKLAAMVRTCRDCLVGVAHRPATMSPGGAAARIAPRTWKLNTPPTFNCLSIPSCQSAPQVHRQDSDTPTRLVSTPNFKLHLKCIFTLTTFQLNFQAHSHHHLLAQFS